MKKNVIIFSFFLFFFSSFSCVYGASFSRPLSVGSTGDDVLMLQKILNQDPFTRISESGAGSPGNETVYFGEKTKDAVMRFQEKYKEEILYPLNLTSGTGFVGSLSLQKLNTLSTNNAIVTTTTYSVLSPVAKKPEIILENNQIVIKEGQTVTLLGKNFENDTKIVFSGDSGKITLSPLSVTENSLSFVFSSPLTIGIMDTLKELEDFDIVDDMFESMQKALGGSGNKIEVSFSATVISGGISSLPIKVIVVIEK